MYRFLDHIAFAVGNFLFGIAASRSGGVDALSSYALGMTVALIIIGLIKLLIINPMAMKIGPAPEIYKSLIVRLMIFVGVISVIIITFQMLFGLPKWICYAIGLLICTTLIEFYRIYWLLTSKEKSANGLTFVFAVASILAVFLVNFKMAPSVDLIILFVSWCFLVWMYFLEKSKIKPIDRKFLLTIKDRLKEGILYWVINSSAAHLPVILMAYVNKNLVSLFYIYRSFFNAASLMLRPAENQMRINLGYQEGSRPVLIFIAKSASLIFLVCLILVIFGEELIFLLWKIDLSMEVNNTLAFSIYFLGIWVLVAIESMYMKRQQIQKLSLIRIGEMMLACLLVALLVKYALNSFVLILASFLIPIYVSIFFGFFQKKK